MPTATSTATPEATATPTVIPTVTAVTPPPTPTPTAMATAEPQPSNPRILVGPGFSDVSSHQVIRTSSGRVYVIVPSCLRYPDCGDNELHAYKADQVGTPGGFSIQDPGNQPSGGIGSSAIAVDGQDRIHVLWHDRNGRVRYALFDTRTDRWGVPSLVDSNSWTTFGQGDEGVGLALDGEGNPHAVWTAIADDGRQRIRYGVLINGQWIVTQNIDDVSLSGNLKSWHPTIAFTVDGRLVLAWIRGTFNYTPDGTIWVRIRSASGEWSAAQSIPETAMTSIDNGPSLLVTDDNTVHLTFLDTANTIRYWYADGGEWRGDRQPPHQVTHNPSLGPDGHGGVYIYGHGTPDGDISGHGDDLYRFRLPSGGGWSGWSLYVEGAYDSSAGIRGLQFFHYFPDTLDVIYWADPYPNVLYLGTESSN